MLAWTIYISFAAAAAMFLLKSDSRQGARVLALVAVGCDRRPGAVLEKAGRSEDDIDWLVPHQANIRIISATAKKLGMSMDNVVTTVASHGNTSAASVPLAFDVAVRDGRIDQPARPGIAFSLIKKLFE